MIEKYLTPGNKVEIQLVQRVAITDDDTEQKPRTYLSKINQALDEDKVEIMMPIEQSKMVLMPRNAVGTMIIYTSSSLIIRKL